MSEIDPSMAHDGGDRQTARATSALLSAAEIWSTAPSRAKSPENKTPENGAPESGTPENGAPENGVPEKGRPEEATSKTTSPPPEIVEPKPAGANEKPATAGRNAPAPRRNVTAKATPGPRGLHASHRGGPPRKLSLALQGGGSFGAFTWGVLERLLEEPDCGFDTISGASGGAVNAVLLACGLVEGGREGARKLLARFWNRITTESSFRSLMLIGGFSPAGSSVAFGPTLRSAHFDPFDLDPLRQALAKDIHFAALSAPECVKLLVAATRIRDGRQQIFSNAEITADVLLASTCPPLVHCAVEIDGEAYWDGGYSANPPIVRLLQESQTTDLLVVQVTPSRDSYVPITMAAIDRRLDQITANSVLNAEMAALEWARDAVSPSLRLSRISAEDAIDGLSQRSSADLGRGFIRLLHRGGRDAADRWLRGKTERTPASERQAKAADMALQPTTVEAAV
jgi:NTE family protein